MATTLLNRDREAALAVASALVYDKLKDETLDARTLDGMQYIFDILQEMRQEIAESQQPQIVVTSEVSK